MRAGSRGSGPALKAETVTRMKQHREADRLVAGAYLTVDDDQQWRGCFHGCLVAEKIAEEHGVLVSRVLPGSWWRETERRYGIPWSLGELLDNWFERLDGEHGWYAVETLEAIAVGADLGAIDVNALDDATWRALYAASDDARTGDRAIIATICAALAGAPIPATASETEH